MSNHRTYAIIAETDKNNVNYSEVFETSANTLRLSIDQTQAVIKWEGATPSCIGPSCSLIEVDGRTTHNHSQILIIIHKF
jgi:hypothetical protein